MKSSRATLISYDVRSLYTSPNDFIIFLRGYQCLVKAVAIRFPYFIARLQSMPESIVVELAPRVDHPDLPGLPSANGHTDDVIAQTLAEIQRVVRAVCERRRAMLKLFGPRVDLLRDDTPAPDLRNALNCVSSPPAERAAAIASAGSWSKLELVLARCMEYWSCVLPAQSLIELVGIDLLPYVQNGAFKAQTAPILVPDPSKEYPKGQVRQFDWKRTVSRVESSKSHYSGKVRGDPKAGAKALSLQCEIGFEAERLIDVIGIRPNTGKTIITFSEDSVAPSNPSPP